MRATSQPTNERVAVRHFAGQHVCDGLDSAVRVPREAGDVLERVLRAEVVEEEERVHPGHFGVTEGAPKVDAGPLDGGAAFEDGRYGSVHGNLGPAGPARAI